MECNICITNKYHNNVLVKGYDKACLIAQAYSNAGKNYSS